MTVVYDLCSVVVHSGISSESGHYYCYSRECTDTVPHGQPQDGMPKPASDKQLDFEIQWYLFNDTRVSFSSFESVSNVTSFFPKDTAYVLFYRQRPGRQSCLLHEALAEAGRLHGEPSLHKDLMEAISKDNILFLQVTHAAVHSRVRSYGCPAHGPRSHHPGSSGILSCGLNPAHNPPPHSLKPNPFLFLAPRYKQVIVS